MVSGKKWFWQPSVNTEAGKVTGEVTTWTREKHHKGKQLATVRIVSIVTVVHIIASTVLSAIRHRTFSQWCNFSHSKFYTEVLPYLTSVMMHSEETFLCICASALRISDVRITVSKRMRQP